jgi:hypothetical protein
MIGYDRKRGKEGGECCGARVTPMRREGLSLFYGDSNAEVTITADFFSSNRIYSEISSKHHTASDTPSHPALNYM